MKKLICFLMILTLILSPTLLIFNENVSAEESFNSEYGEVSEITSGITYQNSTTHLGFDTIVNPDELPEWVQHYAHAIGPTSNQPFNVKEYGIPAYLEERIQNPYWQRSNSGTYSSSVPYPGTYYVLTILIDEAKQPIGYLETTVEVTESQDAPIDIPEITSGISFGDRPNDIGFDTFLNSYELPEELNEYSFVNIYTSNQPFNVVRYGFSEWITEQFDRPNFYRNSSETYGSSVPKSGTCYVLVILLGSSNQPIGFLETTVEVTGDLLEVAKSLVQKAEETQLQKDVDSAKDLVNQLPNGQVKTSLLERLKDMQIFINVSNNLDLLINTEYISITAIDEAINTLYQSFELIKSLKDGVNKNFLLTLYETAKTEITDNLFNLLLTKPNGQPNRLSTISLELLVVYAIQEVNAKSMKDRGLVIAYLMPKVRAYTTGNEINKKLKDYLN